MNRNSALAWLPKIEAAGLPTPRTEIIPYVHGDIISIFDGLASTEFDRICGDVRQSARRIGYPCFIRTDLGSAKHSGPTAYRLSETGSVAPLLRNLQQDQEMKFWLEPEGPQAILVREFLDLESKFEAFRGLPVNREFRFFSDGFNVLCAHPYWPHGAIEGNVDEDKYPNWRDDLSDLHANPRTAEMNLLEAMAETAARAQCGGHWSVDFAQDRGGKWYLIDMASAEDSFHWPECENAEGQPAPE